MKRSVIEELHDSLHYHCVLRLSAESESVMNRWDSSEFAYFKEGFKILPIPGDTKTHENVKNAQIQWNKKEKNILKALNMDKINFLKEFNKARDSHLAGTREWETFIFCSAPIVYGCVRNMSWVNLFAWILPLADKENHDKHKEIGLMVASLFYIEMLYKYGKNTENSEALANIEAKWQILNLS